MKNGFTLVELSIVLVIIGLLIGGILVGQSLIEAARVQAQIKQIQQFDIAFYGFQEKFKQLPGDSSFFATAGDNDGEIENDKTLGAGSSTMLALRATEEKASFWKHLGDAGMLNKTYTNTDVTGPPYVFSLDVNFPSAAVKKTSVVSFGYTGIAPRRLFWLIHNGNTNNGTGGVAIQDAAAIDAKLDDGLGYGFSSNKKTVYTPLTSCAGSGGPTSGPYELGTPQDCVLAIEIGLAAERY